MVVSLTGYVAIGETGSYVSSRREWKQIGPAKSTNVNMVIGLRKYRIPSEDEIVDLIVGKAYELNKKPDKKTREGSLESELRRLDCVQTDILEGIRNRNPEIMLFIRKNTSAPVLKEGQKIENVAIRYSVLPYQFTDQLIESGELDESVFQDEKLKNLGLGDRWYLQLGLVKGLIPSRKVMRTLINCRTPSSVHHTIVGVEIDPKEVIGVLNVLYSSVPTRDRVNEIKDISESHLETLAKQPIQIIIEKEESKKRQKAYIFGKMVKVNLPNNLPN